MRDLTTPEVNKRRDKSWEDNVRRNYRRLGIPYEDDPRLGGCFVLMYTPKTALPCIASTGDLWDHVSVHTNTPNGKRIPTWSEMCFVKDFFFTPEEVCVQFHVATKDHINDNPNVLHIWRPVPPLVFPLPPKDMV